MVFIVPPGRNPVIKLAFELHAKAQRAEKRKSKQAGEQQDPPAAPKKRARPKKRADKTGLALPKEGVIPEHGTYMAIVRRLDCRRCGRPAGPKRGNDFCHSDEGKGAGIKTDVRRGWAGCPPCHKEVGEGTMPRPEKRRLNEEYAASTRAEVEAKGLWPKGLAKWKGAKK